MFIHRLGVPRALWQLDVQNCWALRHRQAFLPVSRKQNPVHVHTEILSRPGRLATSKSLSFISLRGKAHIHDGRRQKILFLLYVRCHELVHVILVVHDVSSFQNKKPKQTVKPVQYGLESNFKASSLHDKTES